MAFTVTARGQEHNGTSSSATETLSAFTPNNNSLVVVALHGELDLGDGDDTLPASPITGGLTWTEEQSYESTAAPTFWATGNVDNRLNSGLFHAPVVTGSSITLVGDATSTAQACYYSMCALDVTGHNVASPIVQSAKNSSANTSPADSVSLAVTLGTALTTGNLVVVSFGASTNSGGGFAAPTIGTKSMTQVYNRNGAYCQNGLWYRVIDGTETNAVTTCTDLGQSVGNGTAFAIEVAAAAATSIEQEGFRFRTDSGNEATPTWEAAQDTNVTMAAEVTKGLRVLIDYTGDPATGKPKLQWRKVGDAASEWEAVT